MYIYIYIHIIPQTSGTEETSKFSTEETSTKATGALHFALLQAGLLRGFAWGGPGRSDGLCLRFRSCFSNELVGLTTLLATQSPTCHCVSCVYGVYHETP